MVDNIYFIGIGGIGMSALARHFKFVGKNVAGYDKTPSRLTNEIQSEKISVIFEDDENLIPETFRDKEDTLVVYTPAIPADSHIYQYFLKGGFNLQKRATTLGMLTKELDAICISGTHGKTTTSTLVAHILRNSTVGCSAFLGGISANYATNYWSNAESSFVVTEADEYDRSFLHLYPYLSLITAMDADHLDIYGNIKELRKAFHQFASQTQCGGSVVYKYGIDFDESVVDEDVEIFTYSCTNAKADFYASKIILTPEGLYICCFKSPMGHISNLVLWLPGLHNVENAVAAIALATLAGAQDDEIRESLLSFRGNRRRFEFHLRTQEMVLIDDYAHHPQEIATMLNSVRSLYPNRKLTVCFQPHLYTRTRDFADDFAKSLSIADRVFLLDIYPARELPIEGVSSSMLADKIEGNNKVSLTTKERLVEDLVAEPLEVVVVMGAGDIDRLLEPIADRMQQILNAR